MTGTADKEKVVLRYVLVLDRGKLEEYGRDLWADDPDRAPDEPGAELLNGWIQEARAAIANPQPLDPGPGNHLWVDTAFWGDAFVDSITVEVA